MNPNRQPPTITERSNAENWMNERDNAVFRAKPYRETGGRPKVGEWRMIVSQTEIPTGAKFLIERTCKGDGNGDSVYFHFMEDPISAELVAEEDDIDSNQPDEGQMSIEECCNRIDVVMKRQLLLQEELTRKSAGVEKAMMMAEKAIELSAKRQEEMKESETENAKAELYRAGVTALNRLTDVAQTFFTKTLPVGTKEQFGKWLHLQSILQANDIEINELGSSDIVMAYEIQRNPTIRAIIDAIRRGDLDKLSRSPPSEKNAGCEPQEHPIESQPFENSPTAEKKG